MHLCALCAVVLTSDCSDLVRPWLNAPDGSSRQSALTLFSTALYMHLKLALNRECFVPTTRVQSSTGRDFLSGGTLPEGWPSLMHFSHSAPYPPGDLCQRGLPPPLSNSSQPFFCHPYPLSVTWYPLPGIRCRHHLSDNYGSRYNFP